MYRIVSFIARVIILFMTRQKKLIDINTQIVAEFRGERLLLYKFAPKCWTTTDPVHSW